MGYNNLRFDEVTRNILYRNFYDPCAYSWQKEIRVGIYLMFYVPVMRPEGIVWPENEDGFQVSV